MTKSTTKKRRTVHERNQKNYDQFRRQFKKWFWKYRSAADRAKMSSEGVTFYAGKKVLANYFAPDYTTYIRRMCRGLL